MSSFFRIGGEFLSNYIALDVGGSTIKGALVDKFGKLLCTPLRFPSFSNKTKEDVTGQLTLTINELLKKANKANFSLCGIGIAFPGPFDYEKGISLMKNMGKFDCIYGLSLSDEIKKEIPSFFPIKYANDADLYALGESNFGEGRQFSRVMCVCIGTGIGSGFCQDGRLVKEGLLVPCNGWIYNSPYKDATADLYASATGIRRMIKSDPDLCDIKDVKELADLANSGDKKALSLFSHFGEILKEILLPHLIKFKADCLVLGGEVARSAKFFTLPLERALAERQIALRVSHEFSSMTLCAVPVLFKTAPYLQT